MSKFSREQIDYMNSMTPKQRRVLSLLSDFPFQLSVSERADPEMYELIRQGYARCYSGLPGDSGLWMWGATELGVRAVKHFKSDRVLPQPG